MFESKKKPLLKSRSLFQGHRFSGWNIENFFFTLSGGVDKSFISTIFCVDIFFWQTLQISRKKPCPRSNKTALTAFFLKGLLSTLIFVITHVLLWRRSIHFLSLGQVSSLFSFFLLVVLVSFSSFPDSFYIFHLPSNLCLLLTVPSWVSLPS